MQVMKTRKTVLGVDHPDTLISMANLAIIYSSQRRWKEVEELEVQVMETRKRVLGEKHPSTLSSMNNLAFTLKGQNRNKEAILLMKKCFVLRMQVFGPEHPKTAASFDALHSGKIQNTNANTQTSLLGCLYTFSLLTSILLVKLSAHWSLVFDEDLVRCGSHCGLRTDVYTTQTHQLQWLGSSSWD